MRVVVLCVLVVWALLRGETVGGNPTRELLLCVVGVLVCFGFGAEISCVQVQSRYADGGLR